MGMIHNKTACVVHGQVEYALVFHVPLLVGRLIEEPLVVLRPFTNLVELTEALSDRALEMVRKAHAADDVRVQRLSFSLVDDPASATIELSAEHLTGAMQTVVATEHVDEATRAFQKGLLMRMQETIEYAKTWGTML